MKSFRKVLAATVLAAAAVSAAPAFAATTIVALDSIANASLDGSNGVSTALAAGTYHVTFSSGAFSRFSSTDGCDLSGAHCRLGFEDSARLIVNGTTLLFGDGNASGGLGPISGGGYFDEPATAFGHSSIYNLTFTLAAPGTVTSFLYDDYLGDNRGGLSLAFSSAVPEPATWLMMILGFGLVGVAMRKGRRGNGGVLTSEALRTV